MAETFSFPEPNKKPIDSSEHAKRDAEFRKIYAQLRPDIHAIEDHGFVILDGDVPTDAGAFRSLIRSLYDASTYLDAKFSPLGGTRKTFGLIMVQVGAERLEWKKGKKYELFIPNTVSAKEIISFVLRQPPNPDEPIVQSPERAQEISELIKNAIEETKNPDFKIDTPVASNDN